jgi:large subunit ribosomal protein L30
MGRNPVVGRQGPAHHAAVIPAVHDAKRLRVKQIRSGIGHAETMRRTLKAIGLRHYQAVVEVDNTETMRGMLTKVRHLVDVTPVGGK